MSYGYSLRSNAKGHRGHKSTDDDQVEGTSIGTSTDTSSTRERGRKNLTDELEADSGINDSENSDTPNSPAPTQDSKHQPTLTSPIRVADRGRPEAWEDIQAARQREEARSLAKAAHIRHEQIVRVYEAELHGLGERVAALRDECEVEVERTRRKWARSWAFESGEVAVVVEEPSSSGGLLDLEASQSMAWTCRRPGDRVPGTKYSRSKDTGQGAERLATPNAQGVYCHSLPGPSWALAANAQGQQFPWVKERAEEGRRTHHPQPLRREPAQLLMEIDGDKGNDGLVN